jgi:hypothetical protein
MDAFFASVEQRDNPELKGKPIAVTGGGERTVITTSSYEACTVPGIFCVFFVPFRRLFSLIFVHFH